MFPWRPCRLRDELAFRSSLLTANCGLLIVSAYEAALVEWCECHVASFVEKSLTFEAVFGDQDYWLADLDLPLCASPQMMAKDPRGQLVTQVRRRRQNQSLRQVEEQEGVDGSKYLYQAELVARKGKVEGFCEASSTGDLGFSMDLKIVESIE